MINKDEFISFDDLEQHEPVEVEASSVDLDGVASDMTTLKNPHIANSHFDMVGSYSYLKIYSAGQFNIRTCARLPKLCALLRDGEFLPSSDARNYRPGIHKRRKKEAHDTSVQARLRSIEEEKKMQLYADYETHKKLIKMQERGEISAGIRLPVKTEQELAKWDLHELKMESD